jgi:hypothetical protein
MVKGCRNKPKWTDLEGGWFCNKHYVEDFTGIAISVSFSHVGLCPVISEPRILSEKGYNPM